MKRAKIELRHPSIVLSVRLSEDEAKALLRLGRDRGGISAVLREAIEAYLATPHTDVWWTPDCGYLHVETDPTVISTHCPDGVTA